MAVASLVIGILATIAPFLFLLSPTFVVLAIPLAAVALVLGVIARKGAMARSEPTGTATAGVVLGVIPLLVSCAMLVVCAKAISAAKDFSAKDPATRERMMKERVKNTQEFNELFNKAIEQDQTSPAPKKK